MRQRVTSLRFLLSFALPHHSTHPSTALTPSPPRHPPHRRFSRTPLYSLVDLLFSTFALIRPLSTHSSPPSFPRFLVPPTNRFLVSLPFSLPLRVHPSTNLSPSPLLSDSLCLSTLSTSFSTFGGETYPSHLSTRFLLLPLLLLLLPPLTPSTTEAISSLTLATPYDFCRPLHSLTPSPSLCTLFIFHRVSLSSSLSPLLSLSLQLSIYLSIRYSSSFSRFLFRVAPLHTDHPTHSSPISPSNRPRALFLHLPSPPKPKPPPRSGTPTQI